VHVLCQRFLEQHSHRQGTACLARSRAKPTQCVLILCRLCPPSSQKRSHVRCCTKNPRQAFREMSGRPEHSPRARSPRIALIATLIDGPDHAVATPTPARASCPRAPFRIHPPCALAWSTSASLRARAGGVRGKQRPRDAAAAAVHEIRSGAGVGVGTPRRHEPWPTARESRTCIAAVRGLPLGAASSMSTGLAPAPRPIARERRHPCSRPPRPPPRVQPHAAATLPYLAWGPNLNFTVSKWPLNRANKQREVGGSRGFPQV